VRQQASKTQIPPYGLTRRRQFPMPSDHRRSWEKVPMRRRRPALLMPPPPWLPASQCSPKGEKTCPDSRPTRMQNFTPLALSAAEKSVTVQKQQHDKQNYTQ